MPRAVREPRFVMFSITVLLCTTAALDEKEKRTQHPRSSLQTYIRVQIIGAHTQSSGGLMTSLDWSSRIWVSPWHLDALHFQGFLCDSLLFPNISGAPSCLSIPFLKVSPIILSFLPFPFITYSVLERNDVKVKRDKNCDHRITEQLRVEGSSGGHLVHPPAQASSEPAAQDHVQVRFEHLQGQRYHIWVAYFYAWLHSEWKSASRCSNAASSLCLLPLVLSLASLKRAWPCFKGSQNQI